MVSCGEQAEWTGLIPTVYPHPPASIARERTSVDAAPIIRSVLDQCVSNGEEFMPGVDWNTLTRDDVRERLEGGTSPQYLDIHHAGLVF